MEGFPVLWRYQTTRTTRKDLDKRRGRIDAQTSIDMVFSFDQNVSFDLSDTRNYTISLVDDKVGIIESGYLTFSYSTKMNIPEHISVVGTATNFSRLCITRESNLIQLMECES